MSDAVIISLIAAIVAIVNAILTTMLKINLNKYHKDINGRMGDLIETTKKLGNAEGTATEKAKHKTKAL